MAGPDVDKISLRMEALWAGTEERIMADVVRRIRQYGEITSTADYQINRLIDLGESTEWVEQTIKESLDATYPEMYELYDQVANWQYVRNEDIYMQVNGEFVPPENNEWLIQISEASKKQTADELANLAQSFGFTVMMGNKRVFTPFAQYYQQYVDAAIMDIISGGFDYNTVIRRVVSQMTNSGLRTVNYASGYTNRTPVAVRRAILTGVSQITRQVNERNAALLGTDYYEVSWHSSARPEHRKWQGKVYSHKDLVDICGLGSVTGLCGANCRHEYYPFIPGVSERLYTDEWLEEQNRKESHTKTWNGKEYDAYEQTQKQRQMETSMRAQRQKVDLLKEAGASKDEITLARCKYQAQLDEYSQYCRKMGLKEQRERIYIDGRGRIAPGKQSYQKYLTTKAERQLSSNAVKSIAKAGKGGIIKVDAKPGSAKYRDVKRHEIVKYCISQDRPIFAVDDFGKYISKVPAKDGFYDVALHGSPKYAKAFGEHINADTLAEIIRNRRDFDGKSSVRLLSCSTGKGNKCFAQMLANKLNVPVEAPNDIIWAREDGTYTIGPSKYINTGKMITFYPGGE